MKRSWTNDEARRKATMHDGKLHLFKVTGNVRLTEEVKCKNITGDPITLERFATDWTNKGKISVEAFNSIELPAHQSKARRFIQQAFEAIR